MNEDLQLDERISAALWVGRPQSVSEHSRLYQWLISRTERPFGSPGPVVVFDDVVMPIKELVEAFTTDEAFVGSAVSHAHSRDIKEASMGVLLFAPAGSTLWRGSVPDGELTYLGTFGFPIEDLPQ